MKKNPQQKNNNKKTLVSRHFIKGWVLHGSDSQRAAATEFNSLTAFSAEDSQNTYRVRVDGSFRMTCVRDTDVMLSTQHMCHREGSAVQCTSVKLYCMVIIVLTS